MTQKTKYLIFDVSSQCDSLTAVVECTPEYVKLLKRRMALASNTKELDGDFSGIEFYDCVDLYEYSDVIDTWIDANSDPETFGDRLWVVVDTKPDFEGAVPVQTACTRVHVDVADCFWEICPKHSDQVCQTQVVRADDDEFFTN